MTAAKTTDRRTLEKARDLLEATHARIENIGFDIQHYGGVSESGPSCYIGTVRQAAGLDGHPIYGRADVGNGPELPVAFATLDSVVANLLEDGRARDVELLHPADYAAGRMVEAYGFQVRDAGLAFYDETDEALRVMRLALTEIHNQLEVLV